MTEETIPSPPELLSLEDRQLYLFLTEIRAVGEEKSDLYPEPQYFSATLMGVAVNWPYVLDKVIQRCGSAAQFGKRAQRVLSLATGLHFSVIATIITHGREMLLLEKGVPGQHAGVVYDDGQLSLTDDDTADVLRFAYDAMRHYRQDGRVYPSDTRALGSNYRILPSEEAQNIAARTSPVDEATARDVLGLMAAVRALSFLMEAETREALMVHGPYPVDGTGNQLVVFECSDLHWKLFPNFPLSGGARWKLPQQPFPMANLAIAIVLRDVTMTADRHGTLYIDPLGPKNVVSARLMTRGEHLYRDAGLQDLPLSEARALRKLCDEIQEAMFLQVANWDKRQRMEAGVFQEETIMLRVLAAAGLSEQELIKEQASLLERGARVYRRHFDSILNRPTGELPFFHKLGEFISQKTPTIFTPLTLRGTSP